MDNQELSNILRSLRKERITASELSIKAGMAEAQISRIENNARDYRVSQLLKYCEGAGIEIILKKKKK
jgi:transcriptional regulator with XRE-family HTH domain